MLSFALGAQSISIFLDGDFYSIDNSHANYESLLAEIKKPADERDIDAIRGFITIKAMIERLFAGRVTVFDTEIHYDGERVHNVLAERMLDLLAQGFDIGPWAMFMDHVFINPAEYTREELYQWLEKAKMPITEDGCFLAFKKVRQDYKDCHTGKFDNSPGSVLEMSRASCDPNRDNACSTGFHFCSIDYLKHFSGQRVVVVKVNPADVTSIPSDYDYTKGRCCRYEVIGELSDESAARHSVWQRGLLRLDNPQEFPFGVIKNIKLPAPCVNEPVFEKNCWVPPKARTLIDQAAEMDDEGEDDRSPLEKLAAANAGMIEDEATDAGKGTTTVTTTPAEIQAKVYAAGASWTAGEPVECSLGLRDSSDDAEMVFRTTDGREFAVSVIQAAMKDASMRGAAKNLGIADSTLRGWLKTIATM